MLGKVKTILDRLNTKSAAGDAAAWSDGQSSLDESEGPVGETSADGSEGAPPTHLFRCRSCDRVYVATEKQACSECDTAVDRVE